MALSNGELFLRLLGNIKPIYKEELLNESYINLYNAGKYWVAFEKSAYFLSLLIDKDADYETIVLSFPNMPFPIICFTIDDRLKFALTSSHVVHNSSTNFLKIEVRFSSKLYPLWYKSMMSYQ